MKIVAGILLVLVSLVFSIWIVMTPFETPSYTDTDFRIMSLAGEIISDIESVGGKTLEEAYYQSYGSYLDSYASLQETTFNIEIYRIRFLRMFGLFLSSICFILGLYLITGKQHIQITGISNQQGTGQSVFDTGSSVLKDTTIKDLPPL